MCGGLLFIIRPNSILTQILLREIDNYGRWKIPKRGHRKPGFTTSSNAPPLQLPLIIKNSILAQVDCKRNFLLPTPLVAIVMVNR